MVIVKPRTLDAAVMTLFHDCKYIIIVLFISTYASASTKFYLHNAASTISGYQLADTFQGLSLKTSITNTTSGGTDIQITASAGGSTVSWITLPLTQALTISGTGTCNLWGLESNAQANASFRCRWYKYSGGSQGSQLWIAQAPGELTTSATLKNFTATPTSTSFAIGDRIVFEVFLENCSATSGCPTGTMGASRTVTLDYDGPTAAADGDSWVTINENEGENEIGTAAAAFSTSPATADNIGRNISVAAAFSTSPGEGTKTGQVGTAAVAFSTACAVCETLFSPFGISLQVSPAATALANTNGKSAAAAVAFSTTPAVTAAHSIHNAAAASVSFTTTPTCQACTSTPLTGIAFSTTPSVVITKSLHEALAVALGTSPAVSDMRTLNSSIAGSFNTSPTASTRRALQVAVAVAFNTVPNPLSVQGHHSTALVPASITFSVSATTGGALSRSAAAAFSTSPAVVRQRAIPRALAASVTFSVAETSISAHGATAGASVSFSPSASAVKNASTGQGMVVIT